MSKTQKIYKTEMGRYQEAEFNGENESGMIPLGDRVLILPDHAPDKIGSIILTDATKEGDSYSAERGVVVAVGDSAFKWNTDRTRPFEGYKPKVGDRICFDRHSGQFFRQTDNDKIAYRIMEDRAVVGVISKS
jgi:co-chaperonin GroES (HSP10)